MPMYSYNDIHIYRRAHTHTHPLTENSKNSMLISELATSQQSHQSIYEIQEMSLPSETIIIRFTEPLTTDVCGET